ncbi:hypothetical protein MUK42_26803 [Musa troglodytarum]|uniref:Uncharacterized protein n=1 Tax=Musa troglodytarum TaxID=320322 RepID=A0A9E7F6Y3_9LILI|nr:hypothetical protein MUK42_26803 [Musa troglodytarum]
MNSRPVILSHQAVVVFADVADIAHLQNCCKRTRRVTAGDDKPQRRRRRASAWRPSLETIKEERGAPDAADTAATEEAGGSEKAKPKSAAGIRPWGFMHERWFYVHVRTSSSICNAILALKCMRQSTHSKGFGNGIVGDDDIGN